MRSYSSSLPHELQLTVQTFHTPITHIFTTCTIVYNLNMFELICIENTSRSVSHGDSLSLTGELDRSSSKPEWHGGTIVSDS
jgi:hypothetical protein